MTDTNALGTKDGTSVVTPTALKEAVERVTAAVARRDAGCRRDAQHSWRSGRGDAAVYLNEHRETATIASLKLNDLRTILATLSSQAESLEAMASALERIATVDQGGAFLNADACRSVARTILTQYRKTGDL